MTEQEVLGTLMYAIPLGAFSFLILFDLARLLTTDGKSARRTAILVTVLLVIYAAAGLVWWLRR